MTPTVSDQVQHIPLGLFAASPTQPRKRFKPEKVQEMAESVKANGVLQPILARIFPGWVEGTGQPPLEIVAGETRWRGSDMAAKPTIPTLVRDYTDLQVAEIQLTENVDRTDLHAYEEALGIRNLMTASAQAGKPLSDADIGHKLGKSERWVYLRLKLLTLCDYAREAFLEEKFGASVANVIATVTDPDEQVKFTKRVLEGFNGEPFTARTAAQYASKEFMLDLAHAKFDIGAVYPIVVAGVEPPPCHECTKRSGANADLFADAKSGDLCQDSACFKAKSDVAHQQLLDQCRQAGHRIVQGKEALKLLNGEVTLDSGQYKANEPCPALTTDKRQLFDIFGANQRGFVTVEHPNTLALTTLVPAKIVKRELKGRKLLREETKPAPAPEPTETTTALSSATAASQQAAAPAPAAKPKPRTEAQLEAEVASRKDLIFSKRVFMAVGQAVREADEPPLHILRRIAAEDLLDMSADAAAAVQLLIDDLPAFGANATARAVAANAYVDDLTGRELADLVALIRMAEECTNGDDIDTLRSYSTYAVPMAQGFHIDLDAEFEAADSIAAAEVMAEEDQRLGRKSAGDAFAAAHAD